jgi:hypothetical protein
MSAPTSYSEAIFADYLASVLGNFADLLGWDGGSWPVQEAVADALLEMGISNIASATTPFQIRGLRALGRRAIWRAVVQAVAADYTVTDNNQTLEREQLQKQALVALELAETESLEWSPSYGVTIISIKRPADPYVVLPDTERVP